MIYAPLFFLVIIAIILAIKLLKNNEKLELFALFFILLFVWGGNHFNGADWINYLKEYNRLSDFSNPVDAVFYANFEWLFSLFMWGFSVGGFPYEFFVAAIAFTNIFFLLRLLSWLDVRNKETVLVSLFLIEGWSLYHEQLRQSLAVTLCLMAAYFFMRRRNFLCVIYFIVAFGFHSSAIFFAVILFIIWRVVRNGGAPLGIMNILYLTVIFAFGMIAFGLLVGVGFLDYFGLERLRDKYFEYQNNDVYGSALFNAGLVAYGFGFLILLQFKRHVVSQKNVWISVAWSCALLWCFLGPLLRTVSILIRFEHYLLIFFPFVLGVYGYKTERLNKNVFGYAASLLFAATFLVRIVISPAHNVWVQNYDNLFISFLTGSAIDISDARQDEVCLNLSNEGNNFCD